MDPMGSAVSNVKFKVSLAIAPSLKAVVPRQSSTGANWEGIELGSMLLRSH